MRNFMRRPPAICALSFRHSSATLFISRAHLELEHEHGYEHNSNVYNWHSKAKQSIDNMGQGDS